MTFQDCLPAVFFVSAVILLLWAAGGLLGKRLGYGWRKALWLLLALRLLCPLPVTLPARVPAVTVSVSLPESARVVLPLLGASPEQARTEAEKPRQAEAAEPDTAPLPSGTALSLWDWIMSLQLLGAAVLAVIRLRQYRKLRKQLRSHAVPCEDPRVSACAESLRQELGLRRLPQICSIPDGSPMLFGYRNPILLLPEGMDEAPETVLRHELTHFRNHDLLYKLLMVIVSCLYWINPAVLLMKHLAFCDVECVCDSQTTAAMDLSQRKAYSEAILRAASGTGPAPHAFSTLFSGNRRELHRRFENIFSRHSRPAGTAALAAMLLTLTFCTACVSVRGGIAPAETETAPSAPAEIPETVPEAPEPQRTPLVFRTWALEGREAALAQLAEEGIDLVVLDPDAEDSRTPVLFDGSLINVVPMAAEGKLADLTELLEERGWVPDASILPLISDADGRIYAIPYSAYAYGLTANTQLFRQAGLTDENGMPILPTTVEELVQTALTIRRTTGAAGICLIAGDYLGSAQFCNIAWNFGAELYEGSREGGFVPRLDSPEAIAAMEFIRDLRWKYDVLTEDPAHEDFTTGYAHLADGTAAMFLGAGDALSFPVSLGMAPEDLAMGPVPGEAAQFAYADGSVFLFSPDASREELESALTALELLGFGPVLNAGAMERIDTRLDEAGQPAIGSIALWESAALAEYEAGAVAARDGNEAAFAPYLNSLPGSLRVPDLPGAAGLYDALANVLTRVVTDPDADIPALMAEANDAWAAYLR